MWSVQPASKQFQDNNITLAEVEDVLGSAVGQLKMIREAPRVGGIEASVTHEEEEDEEPDGVTVGTWRVHHTLVTTRHRSTPAIRSEVVESSINFLSERFGLAGDELVSTIVALTTVDTPAAFIEAAKQLVAEMLGEGTLDNFTTEVFDAWPAYSRARQTAESRREKLMQLLKVGEGTLQKLIAALLVTTPHSMATERAVSHYNIIKSTRRQAMSEETVMTIGC